MLLVPNWESTQLNPRFICIRFAANDPALQLEEPVWGEDIELLKR